MSIDYCTTVGLVFSRFAVAFPVETPLVVNKRSRETRVSLAGPAGG